ncbi:lytic murein transglycosylase [Oryzibacter oryziterrae]|uniref:lytic murein transglycosylase n=1 Tax=Oryzibacter oryziterrae TaxID=2766474 RepID=UPI001F3C093C|nr:lytic murein transglycosylase [Oryzibacter oryziterrae]
MPGTPFPRLVLSGLMSVLLVACGSLGGEVGLDTPTASAVPALSDGAIPQEFQTFVEGLWPAASAAGVSRATFDRAFAGVGPDPEVLQKAGFQPEFNRKIWDYLDDMTADSRIATGQQMLARYSGLLDQIEARYGVQRQVVLAVWGMESTYGKILEDRTKVKNVVRALATLAWKGGSRAGYGRQQLIAALRILERGDIDAPHMTGSWAGAMGQTQFIPTTYLGSAVDFDGDGHRNIWTSVPDALASTANYLRKAGWQSGATWGYEVSLPVAPAFSDGSTASVGDWVKRGVVRATGAQFPRLTDRATLYRPAGPEGPVFLLLHNFTVIKRYNAANAYALGVGHLADRIAGGGPFVAKWPRGYEPLDEAGRTELQGLLKARGYAITKVDGKIGAESLTAIRTYQASVGLPVDGNASLELLQYLRSGR